MNKGNKTKKLDSLTATAATFLLGGFLLICVAAGTDDARTIAHDKTAAQSKTTIPMAIGGIIGIAAGTILLKIRDRNLGR